MRCGRPRCAAPTGGTVFPQWATARVAPTAFLDGDSERRVREAAPYKGRIPPERAGEDTRPYCGCGSILSFRRGRTLAGPREGFCYFGTHPHPPRMRSAPSPWEGEGFRVGRCADPTSEGEETFPLIRLAFGQPPSPRGRLVLPALARQSQARNENRTDYNFGTVRPQWAGRIRKPPLRFCAPEILLRLSSTRPP